MRRTPFAKSWFEVKEALDMMSEDYISYDHYYALCREKEVTYETTAGAKCLRGWKRR